MLRQWETMDRPADRVPFVRSITPGRDGIPEADRFPLNLPLVRNFRGLDLHPAVTFLVGENGSGKSTFLEAVAVRMGFPETGGPLSKDSFVRDLDGGLHDYLALRGSHRRPSDGFFLRAEAFFGFATELDERILDEPWVLDAYGARSLNERSHGEAFLQLIQERFRWESLFVLDEPEAALSPQRQLVLLKEMDILVRGGCQFLVATHSPILMAYPDAWIYSLDGGRFERVAWEDTDHVRTTRAFLSRPEAFLRHLGE